MASSTVMPMTSAATPCVLPAQPPLNLQAVMMLFSTSNSMGAAANIMRFYRYSCCFLLSCVKMNADFMIRRESRFSCL